MLIPGCHPHKTIENGFLQTGFASNAQGTFLQMMLAGFIILVAVGIDILCTSKSLFQVQQFLSGAGDLLVIGFMIVGPDAQVWVGTITSWEHGAMFKLQLKRDLQDAAIAGDGTERAVIAAFPDHRKAWAQIYFENQETFAAQLCAAGATLAAAEAEFTPYASSFGDAKHLVRGAQNSYSRVVREGADPAERAPLEAAQAETVAIYAQGAKQEVTLTAAKRSRQAWKRVALPSISSRPTAF